MRNAGKIRTVLVAVSLCTGLQAVPVDSFSQPPASDRPWVYWFWKNGNISREGITADLESMQQQGIGGVIIMEVALTVPPGDVRFFSAEWRELFRYAVSEAARLGLVVSMNSAPGWTGSGGPWVTPEQSMQKVVASETTVSGPRKFAETLPQPETVRGFYRDIAVLAFPTPQGDYRIADIREKALYERGPISSMPGVRAAFYPPAEYKRLPAEQVISLDKVVELSSRMDADGRLTWDVPPGRWTLLRFGHTSTGQTNRPAALPGLECDKLDKRALDEHFKHFTAKLLEDVGPLAGKTLVATHLDSWEVGAQNWTAGFRAAFRRRRGYDLLRYLPVMTGRVVEGVEVSERFLWDLRQTVSEMIVENHGRHLHDLARRHGLWLSIEPYDMTPCDDMTLGASADVPMCEFWTNTFDTRYSVKEATSIAHVYGKPVVAVEAFTSGPADAWRLHPGVIKPFGDWAFCEGVNRFVIHRCIHQPFLQIRPGLSLGPHGVHYERTQTWWPFSKPWHEYLARCQHVLRQGRFVADVLYLSPEGAPNVFQRPRPEPVGYKYDACTPEALLTRLGVEDGRLVLPDGMSYRLLVLPEAARMTPEILAKIKSLVETGATVVGVPPSESPSLSGHPQCDETIDRLAGSLWPAEASATELVERSVGKGRMIRCPTRVGSQPKEHIGELVARARWIWHREGQPAASAPLGKRYFRREVTLEAGSRLESARVAMTADNAFTLYVNGREALAGGNFHRLSTKDVASRLRPGANTLAVVAENGGGQPNPAGLIGVLEVRYADGQTVIVHTDGQWRAADRPREGWMESSATGVWQVAMELGPFGMAPWGRPRAMPPRRDVYPNAALLTRILREMGMPPDFEADASLRFAHRKLGATDVYFVSNGEDQCVAAECVFRVRGKRPWLWHPETGKRRPLPESSTTSDGRTAVPLRFEAAEGYFVVFEPDDPDPATKAGEVPGERNFPALGPVADIRGSWKVRFDPKCGGPKGTLTWDELVDWSRRPDDAVRYYSGVATYARTIEIPVELLGQGRRLFLDLGRVEVMAAVMLNGTDLGILWKRPFRVEITGAVRPGANALKVEVVNLWPNRMIGDDRLPPASDRHPNGRLKSWPEWLLDGKPNPTGRHTFAPWNPWTKDSPLLTSGLLGPVRLLKAE